MCSSSLTLTRKRDCPGDPGFSRSCFRQGGEALKVNQRHTEIHFQRDGSADLVAYVGHNGLMDFTLQSTPQARDERNRKAIILACVSKKYFAKPLERTGADATALDHPPDGPEAYILSAAIDGWMKKETDEEVRVRAAKAYNEYQNCGLKAANSLFARLVGQAFCASVEAVKLSGQSEADYP